MIFFNGSGQVCANSGAHVHARASSPDSDREADDYALKTPSRQTGSQTAS